MNTSEDSINHGFNHFNRSDGLIQDGSVLCSVEIQDKQTATICAYDQKLTFITL